MINLYDVIIRLVVIEYSMVEMGEKKYIFVVVKDVNKIEIKKVVEKVFGVSVDKVNILNYDGKVKRMGRI